MDYYSLNRVILIGYVGQAPDVRISKPGPNEKTPRKMARFQLSTKQVHRKPFKPKTVWHNCCAWGARADFVEKYVRAGSLILVEGKLDSYVMKNNEGFAIKHTFVCIDTISFMPMAKRPPIEEPATEDDSLPEGAQDPIDKGNPFL